MLFYDIIAREIIVVISMISRPTSKTKPCPALPAPLWPVRARAVRADELHVDGLGEDVGERVVRGDGRAAPARRLGAHGGGHVAEGVVARQRRASAGPISVYLCLERVVR